MTRPWKPKYNTKRYERAKVFINSKKDRPCMDCGGSFPLVCMDFDHRNQTEKQRSVSAMWGMSLEAIQREIDKCDIVCANCHRIRTLARGQYGGQSRGRSRVSHLEAEASAREGADNLVPANVASA